MSFTNSTTNYGLPQYISTDIPSYLVDQNGAWATIDSALKSASDDATQAINDASIADGKAVTAQTDASSALTKANGALSNIADTFDNTATYSVGDRVIYNAILYVCSTAVTIPGAFDPVNWTRETIEEEIDDIKGDIATINSKLTDKISITSAGGTWAAELENLKQRIDLNKLTPRSILVVGTEVFSANSTDGGFAKVTSDTTQFYCVVVNVSSTSRILYGSISGPIDQSTTTNIPNGTDITLWY